MPTNTQAQACIVVCQYLSNCYQPIHLFRYNPMVGEVFILAGVHEGIEILIPPDGQWRYTDATGL
jgi:hypothetical protein